MVTMRSVVVLAIAVLACGSAASAQTPSAPPAAAPDADRGYVEGVFQSAFGNVTSQSYGAEFGVTVRPGLQVYGEVGKVGNVATAEIGTAAQTIAGFLSQTNANVGYSVKQPVTFLVGGVKFIIPTDGKLRPYVMGGVGMANVTQDVAFTVGGADVTSVLPTQYGVQLGTDLSGSYTKAMISAGAGVMWPAWQRLVVDVQYRYGRILAEDVGISVNRLGVGIGVRF
jgi:opacity protein-like surface antigen